MSSNSNDLNLDEYEDLNPQVISMDKDFSLDDLVPDNLMDDVSSYLREYIEAILKESPTDRIPAAVCAVVIKDAEKGDQTGPFAAVKFSFTTKLYSGDGISNAGSGHAICTEAGKLAAKDHVKPVAAFLISEAWLGTNIEVAPSKDPERKEVLIIGGSSIGGSKQRMYVYDIKRTENNNIIIHPNSELSSATGSVNTRANAIRSFFEAYVQNV